ncbi:MAG TPA: PAS domain S-box protein [Nitrospiraceae bacterium]|nr:PAS domain S-box protein [Nitrospiraceae bacterium]
MNTEPSGHSETHVLIVDDDPDISQALADLLEHEGYQVRVAGTGAEAVEHVKRDHYGAVILDLGLPDIDGLDLLKVLLEVDSKLPIIVLTAYTTAEKTIGALSQGAFAFLTKPYNRVQLKATLDRAVGIKALATRAETVESALTASEDRFRSVVQSASDAIIIAGGAGQIVSWNKAAQQLFGYAEAEVLDKSLTVIMPERYREAHQQGLERLRATGRSRSIGQAMQLSGVRKDGTEFPVELSLATWTTRSETYYCGIIRDITERKRTEAALQQSEERYRVLFEDNPSMYFMVDHTGTVLSVNRFGAERLGYTVDELVGRPVLTVFYDADREAVRRKIAACQQHIGQEMNWEFRKVRKDGSLLWARETARAVRSAGKEPVILIVCEDVTDLKQTEDALRASEERLELAVRGSCDGLWDAKPLPTEHWSSPRTPTWYSPRFKEMLGVTDQEFPNVLGSWFLRLHPGDRERVCKAIAEHIDHKVPYDVEYRLRTNQGKDEWFRARGQAIWDEQGRMVRMAGSLQCITDRKEAEEALREQLRLATFNAELGVVLTRSRTLHDMLSLCTEAMVHHLDAAFARIWLLAPDDAVLELQASSGLYTHVDGPHGKIPLGELKIGRIAKARQPHVTNDVLHDPHISDPEWAGREGMVAFAGYPMIVEDRLIGVVAMFARQPLTGYTTKALAAAANAIAGGVERKQAEEALARLSHQHALILHSAGEGIYGIDVQGRTSFVNDAAARMLGWTAEELIGHSMHPLVHHSKADGSPYPSEECPIYAAFNDGTVHSISNEVFWRKDGTNFSVEYVSTPIREHGKPVGAVVVFKDVTERQRTEEALRESEERFCQVTENIRDVFWLSDVAKDCLLYVSPAYEEIWGRTCASLYLSPRSWLEAIHPDDRARVLDAALTKQSEGQYNEEYRIVRPDGSIRWIHDRAFPVKNALGAVYRIAGIAEDITKRKQHSGT